MKRGLIVALGAAAALLARPAAAAPAEEAAPAEAGREAPVQAAGGAFSVREGRHLTPLALTLFGVGVPYTRDWNVCGVRVNTCLPGLTVGNHHVFGIDAGLSSELGGSGGGVACNVFENQCENFAGVQVGGFYNRVRALAPFALQVTLGHNRSNRINGIQVGGLWNAAERLHGLQIGLVNQAGGGSGLQIGLWNQCRDHGSPLLGAVF